MFESGFEGNALRGKRGKWGIFPAGNSVWNSILGKTRGSQVYGLFRSAKMYDGFVGELSHAIRCEGRPSGGLNSSIGKPFIASFCAVLYFKSCMINSFLV